ncbi:restriction endonuclease subunit S [Pseudomonas sp. CFBP 5750]
MPNNLISPIRQLGELAEVVTKGTTPTTLGHDYVAAGIAFIRANNLVGAYIDPGKDVLFIDETTDNLLRRSRIFPGDVLLSIAGTIGRASRVPANAPALNCNQAVCIIRCTSEIDGDFLRYWLESQSAKKQIASSKVTGVISNLSLTEVKSLKIPLPPLTEQCRIAAILDKIDALRAKRREVIAKLDKLLQAVFFEMFGDPVANPKGWKLISFADVGQWKSGATPSKSEPTYWGGSFPWVSPKDMKVSLIMDAQDHVSDLAFQSTNLKRIEPGHLLIVVRGMILAHSFPTAVNAVPIAINQDMKAINPVKDLDIVYLKTVVDSLKGRILSVVSTAGHGTCRLATRDASEVMIPVPPLEIQLAYRTIANKNSQLRTRALAQLEKLDRMFLATQQKAFDGEL